MSSGVITRAPLRSQRTLIGVVAIAGCTLLGLLAAAEPKLGLAGVVGCAIAVGILVWPEVISLLVVFLLFLNAPAVAVNTHGAPVIVGAMVPLLLAIPVAYHLGSARKLLFDRTFFFILVLFFVEVLSTLASDHQDVAFEKLQTIAIEGVLLYFLALNAVRSPGALRRTVWMVLAAVSALSVLTIYQKVTGDWTRAFGGFGLIDDSFYLGKGLPARPSGPLGDPNYYAQILLVATALGLVSIWRARRLELRVLAIAGTITPLVAIMITDSRGASIGFLLVVAVLGVLGYVRSRQLVVGALAIVLLISLVPGYTDRVASLGSAASATQEEGTDPEADLSVASRTGEMLAAGLVFLDHPLLGTGPATFPLHYQAYARRLRLPVHESAKTGEDKGEEAQRQSHNMFLSVAADLGLPGLVAFLGVIVSSVRQLVQARRRSIASHPEIANLATGFLVGVIAYVSTGLFLTLAFERYFWLLLGLAGAASAIARHATAEEPAATGGTVRARKPLAGKAVPVPAAR